MKYDQRVTFLRMKLTTSVDVTLEGIGKCFCLEYNVIIQVTPTAGR